MLPNCPSHQARLFFGEQLVQAVWWPSGHRILLRDSRLTAGWDVPFGVSESIDWAVRSVHLGDPTRLEHLK